MMKKISRRDFLKGSAAGAVSLAASAVLFDMSSLGVQASEDASADTAEDAASITAIGAFLNPDAASKPMVRLWFPDAYAGIDEYDTVETQIQALAAAGFGGIEVAMMVDGGSFNNEDAALIGWGTDAFRNLLKKVLTAANSIEDGFIVDVTYTAHWPLTVNTIDPNDEEQQQSLVSSWQKVTQDDLAAGSAELNMPAISYYDQLGAPFILKNTLVSSTLAKVESVNEDGTMVLDLSSLTAMEPVEEEKTTGAGIPDAAALAEIETYVTDGASEDDVIRAFGAAGDASNVTSANGKIDADGNRVRMADTQYYYSVDLSAYVASEGSEGDAGAAGMAGEQDPSMMGQQGASSLTISPSDGDDVQAGDYVLVNVYCRGNTEIQSDGSFGGTSVPMYGRCYVPTYFQREGADVVTDYWDEKILDDELTALMQENGKLGSSMFEDSLELTKEGAFWASTVLDKVNERKGGSYQYLTELPVVMAATTNGDFSFNDEALAGQIENDFNLALGALYEECHSTPLSEWAKERLGYTFRAQTYSMSGLDIDTTIDVLEGDNGSKGDGLRAMSAVVNLSAKTLLSMEAVTGMGNNALNWEDVLTELSQNYSDGVNRVILHGSPYSKTANGYNSCWPGWMAFGNCFADSYSYRQAYWDEAENMTTFMAKTQAVLQKSKQKIDIAFMTDGTRSSGNGHQLLLDNGFSYNIITEYLLLLDRVAVTDGVLDADGAAYKALVLEGVSSISSAGLEQVLTFAKEGLPVYMYNCDITGIYGTDCDDDNEAALEATLKNLEKHENVTFVADEETLLRYMEEDGLLPDASYEASGLEATRYYDETDGNTYYYLFYNTKPSNSGMINSGDGNAFKTGTISTEVTLKGEGIPFILDAMDGTVRPAAAYTDNGDGTITLRVKLSGAESVIIAIAADTSEFPAYPAVHAEVAEEGTDVIYEDGGLIFQAEQSGTYEVTLSDGSVNTVEVSGDSEELALDADGWTVTLVSYGPDEEANAEGGDNYQGADYDWSSVVYEEYLLKDPSDTKKTEIQIENASLGAIADLAVTEEQLTEMGVESMQQVSGTVTYTRSFTLPENWESGTGVKVSFTYNRDEVICVTVNGTDIGIVSNITDTADITDYLVTGENTIAVTIATTLLNRTLYTNPWAAADGESPNYTYYGLSVEDSIANGYQKSSTQLGHTSYDTNGLNSVTLTSYAIASLE